MLVKMVFGTVSHPVWNAKNGDLDINNKPWLKSNYFIVYLTENYICLFDYLFISS